MYRLFESDSRIAGVFNTSGDLFFFDMHQDLDFRNPVSIPIDAVDVCIKNEVIWVLTDSGKLIALSGIDFSDRQSIDLPKSPTCSYSYLIPGVIDNVVFVCGPYSKECVIVECLNREFSTIPIRGAVHVTSLADNLYCLISDSYGTGQNVARFLSRKREWFVWPQELAAANIDAICAIGYWRLRVVWDNDETYCVTDCDVSSGEILREAKIEVPEVEFIDDRFRRLPICGSLFFVPAANLGGYWKIDLETHTSNFIDCEFDDLRVGQSDGFVEIVSLTKQSRCIDRMLTPIASQSVCKDWSIMETAWLREEAGSDLLPSIDDSEANQAEKLKKLQEIGGVDIAGYKSDRTTFWKRAT